MNQKTRHFNIILESFPVFSFILPLNFRLFKTYKIDIQHFKLITGNNRNSHFRFSMPAVNISCFSHHFRLIIHICLLINIIIKTKAEIYRKFTGSLPEISGNKTILNYSFTQ